MKRTIEFRKILLKKSMVLALFTALLFFISQFNLLEKYSSYGRARIIVAAEFSDQATPMFTLGYRDVLKLTIAKAISEADILCRSIDLKISTHNFQSIHDIEIYCISNPFVPTSEGRSLDKIVKENLLEWPENKNITVKYMDFNQNNESLSLKIIISLLYILILIASLPWYPVITKT